MMYKPWKKDVVAQKGDFHGRKVVANLIATILGTRLDTHVHEFFFRT